MDIDWQLVAGVSKNMLRLLQQVNVCVRDSACSETVKVLKMQLTAAENENRLLLRSILSIFARLHQEDDQKIKALQHEAIVIHSIHISLLHNISFNRLDDNSFLLQSLDNRCRILSAQVLCNLGTTNFTTAAIILQTIPWSISDERKSCDPIANDTNLLFPASWENIMIMNECEGTSGRKIMAALAATIHNCFAAIQLQHLHSNYDDQSRHEAAPGICIEFAMDAPLVKACLRNISQSMILYSDESFVSDDASEWLSLLIVRLISTGLLGHLFTSAGFQNDRFLWNRDGATKLHKLDNRTNYTEENMSMTPEQIILLRKATRVFHDSCREIDDVGKLKHDPMKLKSASPIFDQAMIICLAQKWCMHQKQAWSTCCLDVHLSARMESNASSTENLLFTEEDWIEPNIILILDILATILGAKDRDCSDNYSSDIRLALGRETPILLIALNSLARITPHINRELNASTYFFGRNKPQTSDRAASYVINLVRLIGNLCYHCKVNQDMLRESLILDGSGPSSGDSQKIEKNGLHVLLSCTSLGHNCFTIREWGILAIRNALEDNEDNQLIVRNLGAQQALNTPELQNMGVQIVLDHGEIRLRHSTVDK